MSSKTRVSFFSLVLATFPNEAFAYFWSIPLYGESVMRVVYNDTHWGEVRVRGGGNPDTNYVAFNPSASNVPNPTCADPVSKGAQYTFGSDSSWSELTPGMGNLVFDSQHPVEVHIGTRDPGSSYTGLKGWTSTDSSGLRGPKARFFDVLAYNALLFCYDSRRGGSAGMRCGALGTETPYEFWQGQNLLMSFKQYSYPDGFPHRLGLDGVRYTSEDPFTFFVDIVNDHYFAGDICVRFVPRPHHHYDTVVYNDQFMSQTANPNLPHFNVIMPVPTTPHTLTDEDDMYVRQCVGYCAHMPETLCTHVTIWKAQLPYKCILYVPYDSTKSQADMEEILNDVYQVPGSFGSYGSPNVGTTADWNSLNPSNDYVTWRINSRHGHEHHWPRLPPPSPPPSPPAPPSPPHWSMLGDFGGCGDVTFGSSTDSNAKTQTCFRVGHHRKPDAVLARQDGPAPRRRDRYQVPALQLRPIPCRAGRRRRQEPVLHQALHVRQPSLPWGRWFEGKLHKSAFAIMGVYNQWYHGQNKDVKPVSYREDGVAQTGIDITVMNG